MDTPELVLTLARELKGRGLMMATAESCTGGLIAGACTDVSGSSDWFERGFVTYSNAAKTELLGVPAELIAQHGAVSEPVARAMAAGARAHSPAQVALAVTGVAGPTGGSADKPVGTVWFGWATPAGTFTEHQCFDGDRAAVRAATVRHALAGLLQRLP
ncbi:MAG: CinA family protein [Hydrogenophaga sp.]|uniref:CinA family protein n=1 Tax=Hydrogenophaga sp. TaxID=1904254 RepID=UPI002ABBF249|nr:CinA family protein [Hydrogenophaga sp.]MDZ4102970.1 CinA family protein [Hydrogenophaga sp.]